MSTPTDTNVVVSISDKIVDAGMQLFQTALVKAVQVAQPWLAWPIIGSLFNLLVGWLLKFVDTGAKTFLSHAEIDKQTGDEGQAAIDAKNALLAAQQSGDANALAKASQDFDTAFGNLIHNDGS